MKMVAEVKVLQSTRRSVLRAPVNAQAHSHYILTAPRQIDGHTHSQNIRAGYLLQGMRNCVHIRSELDRRYSPSRNPGYSTSQTEWQNDKLNSKRP